MNSSLTATLSEFSRKSEFSKNPLAAAPSDEPTRRLAARSVIAKAPLWLGKLFSFAVARVLLIFFIGFAAGLAWQSHGGAARQAIAGWSPRLGWLAPATTAAGASAERLKAMSLALAAARQDLDKLAAEIRRVQAQSTPERRPGPRRASHRL